MAKVLPAGANVNLGLGEDPMDRLLKTIQVASQAQGVMNQAPLQRDSRQAVKEESFQTMMLNTLSSMDKSNISSVNGAEESLKKMKNNFIAENPGMTDKIDTIYGTALSTTINPIKEIHTNFNRDKELILNQIENLDNRILSVNEKVALDGSSSQFKEDFQTLSKSINRYKSRLGEYNSIMPDLAFEMSENVLNATNVLTSLPKSLIGIFDDVEQSYYSDLLNGRMTESVFDAAMTKYYNDTSGRITKQTMPLLASEMKDLYSESYLPLDAFTTQIENDLFPKVTDNQSIVDQTKPTYYDNTNDIYYIEGTPYGNKKEALNVLNQQKENLKIKITQKDLAYRGYAYETEGNQRSYATEINSDGQWAWDRGPSEDEFEFVAPEMVDENKNEISDFVEQPEGDNFSLEKNQERVKLKMSKYPKAAEKKLNKVNELSKKIKDFEIKDRSLTGGKQKPIIIKLSNLIGKNSEVLNEKDLNELKKLYDSNMDEIKNLKEKITTEKKYAKKVQIPLEEGFPRTLTEPGENIKQIKIKIKEIQEKWKAPMVNVLMSNIKKYNGIKKDYDTALNQYNKITETPDASKQN